MPFRFRLERVLQLRERAEREQARALGEALREEARRERERREAEARLARAADQIAGAQSRELPAGSLANLSLARDAAESGVDAARSDVEEAAQRVAEERERFDERRRDRRTVEKLREHRKGEWQLERSRSEQKASDEVRNRIQEGEPK
jgi:flagellar FliJ protein